VLRELGHVADNSLAREGKVAAQKVGSVKRNASLEIDILSRTKAGNQIDGDERNVKVVEVVGDYGCVREELDTIVVGFLANRVDVGVDMSCTFELALLSFSRCGLWKKFATLTTKTILFLNESDIQPLLSKSDRRESTRRTTSNNNDIPSIIRLRITETNRKEAQSGD
jgi:hypothetical protein